MTTYKTRSNLWSLVALFTVGFTLLSACTNPPFQTVNGDVITQEMDFAGFDQVDISDAFSVEIRQGDEFQVTIMVDEESQRYLEANQRGDVVEIGMRRRPVAFFWFFNLFNTVHRAEITMPTLAGATVADASHVTVTGFRTDAEVRFEVSDASSLNGEIETGDMWIRVGDASTVSLEGDRADVDMEVSDASDITLEGAGQNLTARAADASTVNLADFQVQDANVIASDASDVTVDVTGRLDAEADDASSIVYYGDPTLGNITSSDASSISARER